MGVTIDFEGRVRSESGYRDIIATATRFVNERRWPWRIIAEENVRLQRIRKEEPWDYIGPTRGIELRPHQNADPLRLEFDDQLYIQEWMKTQFAPIEIHMAVIELLKLIEPCFSELTVVDEGEYFESGDVERLVTHLNRCFQAMKRFLEEHASARGPVRASDGRIIDVVQ